MKRNLFCLMSVAIIGGILASAAQAKELKVGVIDVEKVYSSYDKAKASAVDFQKERKIKQAEMDKKQADLKALVDEYNKKKDKMRDGDKKDLEKKINDKKVEVLNYKRTTDAELIAKNRDVAQSRLKEVANAVQSYAKDKSFDLIIDKKSLPYFSNALDVSDEIIKLVNTPKP